MNVFKAILSASVALAVVPGAFAQDAAAPATATAPAGSYSDADVQLYATALVAVNKVQVDTTITAADKQTKMAAIVQQSGMDVNKFNAITQAAGTDKALEQRIQTAAAAVPR